MQLSEFIQQLDQLEGPVPLDHLKEMLTALELNADDTDQYLQFDDERYEGEEGEDRN